MNTNDFMIKRITNNIQSPKPVEQGVKNNGTAGTVGTRSFEQILTEIQQGSQEIVFSKHATERLEQRQISLDSAKLEKLNQAIDKAKGKGVNTALILMNDTAFIANVKNKVIITTATEEQLRENVFTNIDGAVII